jgi:DNA-3-methyladenine glycosylase|tara:strand:+ start:281 stop:862 length:582 start_codon:yes stop_codon:yes gene_type:complete
VNSGILPLPRSFFSRPTLTVARESLGKQLVKIESNGTILAGVLVEVEAYIGETDLACHARGGITSRNAAMYGPPGTAYVYFTYGMHWMLNFVTEYEGFPAAVLLRALQPTEGVSIMQTRRKRPPVELTNGPAKATKALGINLSWNKYDMCAPDARLFLADGQGLIETTPDTRPRVGLGNTPEPWRSLPWNYRM